MGVGGRAMPWPLYPLGKRPGTHCIGGWVGPESGLYWFGKSCPHLPACTIHYTDYALTTWNWF